MSTLGGEPEDKPAGKPLGIETFGTKCRCAAGHCFVLAAAPWRQRFVRRPLPELGEPPRRGRGGLLS